MATTIIKSSAVAEVEKDLKEYSIKVNRGRAIVDVRDGLKPVHRRIVDIMSRIAVVHTVKSSRIVGDVMGKLHPHGDSSIYDAMKPMANDFEIKEPLLEKQGQFGSAYGDSAAASRYTEAKLSPYAKECIIGDLNINRNVVDWNTNYDNTDIEVEYMPVKVPNLLINGCFGIGYGMSSYVPRHNLAEVIDATIDQIKNPDNPVYLVPDLCMQGTEVVIDEKGIKNICNLGRGSFVARGRIDISENRNGSYSLLIRSVPDLVFLNKIVNDINNMIKDNSLQVTDLQDKTKDTDTMLNYEIKLKKGVDPNYAKDLLYKRTAMQKRYHVNFEVLDKLEPIRMSYKSYLQHFIKFRLLTKFRLYANLLQREKTKYNEKAAFIHIIETGKRDSLIEAIDTVNTTNDSILEEYLIDNLDITPLQAKYLINVNVKRLAPAYLKGYLEDAAKYQANIDEYTNKMLNDQLLLDEIVDELLKIKSRFGKPRVSTLISKSDLNNIPKADFKIIITENNFIKKIPAEFPNGSLKDDRIKMIVKGCNTKAILIFDEHGKVFRVPIHKIFVSDKSSNGVDFRTIVKSNSNIVKVIYEPTLLDLNNKKDKYYLTVLNSSGLIKKLDLNDFINIPRSGIIYTKLSDGDFVKSINMYHNAIDIVVFNMYEALRINMVSVPHQKRNNKGQKTLINAGAEGMSLIAPNNDELLVITNKGYVNRFNIVALPRTDRNKSGNTIIKLTRGDSIKSVHSINKNMTTLKISTTDGVNDISLNNIGIHSSISKGDKIKLNKSIILSTGVY